MRNRALVHFNGIWAYAAKRTMKSCSQERGLLDSGKPALPVHDGVFRQPEAPAYRVESHFLGPDLEHLNDKADGLSDSGQEGVGRLRKMLPAGFVLVN
jgi:hypothetical protein